MITKRIAITCLAASLVVVPSSRLAASDGVVGGIIGGIIGGAIVRESQRSRTTTTVRTAPSATAVQRQSNRDVQTSLNYFSFPAGTVDGVIGRNTRAAISQYQAFMGYPATGQLTQFERDFLVTSYQRAMAGGPVTAQLVASHPQGTRGLLLQFRDEMLGVTSAAAPAPEPVRPAQPETAAVPVLPNFLGGGVVQQASLASHCNRVNLITGTNGGFVTAASMTDPALALDEQFCLARTYAIGIGEDLGAKLPGVTPQQLAQQCEGFGPAMQAQIAAVSVRGAPQVLADVGGFVVGTGMAPVQLASSARICLGTGYRVDNMDVAIASALILVALGERGYSELIGHHLHSGFGVNRRTDLALEWYDMSVTAAKSGERSPFAPGQSDRAEVIRAASEMIGGRSPGAMPATSPAALPSFGIPSRN